MKTILTVVALIGGLYILATPRAGAPASAPVAASTGPSKSAFVRECKHAAAGLVDSDRRCEVRGREIFGY